MQSKFSYEIELKSLLSDKEYDSLKERLPNLMKLINKESLHTSKFISKNKDDIRLRYSKKRFELVHKKGKVTDFARKESTIKLQSKEEIDTFLNIFRALNFTEEPGWITHRRDFEYGFDNKIYSVSLQNTENFAKLLEVEFVTEKESDIDFYKTQIKKIIENLGCKPIDSDEFNQEITKYIEKNKKV